MRHKLVAASLLSLALGSLVIASQAQPEVHAIPGTTSEKLAVERLDDEYRSLQASFDKLSSEALKIHADELHGYTGRLAWDRRENGWVAIDSMTPAAVSSRS